jgi:hypothetical protein
MEEFAYFDVAYDNSLTVFNSGISPEYADVTIEDSTRITAIRFVYKTGDGEVNSEMESELLERGFDSEISKLTATRGETFTSKLYFIGKIVTFDEIKNLIGENSEKYEKYAVSYDENGKVYDIRPIFNDTEEVIPVHDASELEAVYSQLTGKNISIVSSSSSKKY